MRLDAVTSHTVEPVARPPAPVNMSARWLPGGGVELRWRAGRGAAAQSTLQFIVEYRTVGPWVPLIDRVDNTSHTWKTASRGVTYQFRVRQVVEEAGSTSVRSRPSSAVKLLPEGSLTVLMPLNFIAQRELKQNCHWLIHIRY